MKFDEFRDDLIKRSINSYDIPLNQYNHHYENIPLFVPSSLRWMIALYMSFSKRPFNLKDYREVLEFKVK